MSNQHDITIIRGEDYSLEINSVRGGAELGGGIVYTGDVTPPNSLGVDGDHYMNYASEQGYTKKAGVWVTNSSITLFPIGNYRPILQVRQTIKSERYILEATIENGLFTWSDIARRRLLFALTSQQTLKIEAQTGLYQMWIFEANTMQRGKLFFEGSFTVKETAVRL